MQRARWIKSPDTLVTRRFDEEGVVLKHQRTGGQLRCGPADAERYAHWARGTRPEDFEGCGEQLVRQGFVELFEPPAKDSLPRSRFDDVVPCPEPTYLRWYAETPDLSVLFNSRAMDRNNPLLALGPYGSLVWRGVLAREPIARIREESRRVFGRDEVVSFLARLESNGMLRRSGDLDGAVDTGQESTKEFPAPTVQHSLVHARVPWYCLWELNTACDLRCQICYLPNFSSKGPTEEQTTEIAGQIIDAGIFYVCLLGGETLLREDLERIVARLRSAGLFVKVITNGHRLTPERLHELALAGLNMIEVSFDGLTRETHDGSRGEGAFEKAVQATRRVRESSIPRMAMVWTAHSGNFGDIDRLPDFMDELGVRECYISRFKKTGRNGAVAPFLPLDSEHDVAAYERLNRWREEYPELAITLMPSCSCGRTSTVIGHDGEVRTCSFSYMTNVGNVLETPFDQIWRGLEPRIPASGPVGICSRDGATDPNSVLAETRTARE